MTSDLPEFLKGAGDCDPPDAHERTAKRRRVSPLRLAVALLLVGAVAASGAWYYLGGQTDEERYATTDSWAAPYVDITVVPRFDFEAPGTDVSDVVLSFVVAYQDDACIPAWGGVFDLDEAGDELDLDRRLVRLRQIGKDAIVSFGGALNQELAVACVDSDALTQAYLDVISRYEISTVDFDLEGEGLANLEAHARRAAALAVVQQRRREEGHELAIWFTLPATPQGITEQGVAALDAALDAGVDVAGVNLMVMNFGQGRGSMSMLTATESALDGVVVQLMGAWRRAGLEITPSEAWARLGVTPMIGRNDVATDVFTLADAAGLAQLVEERGLARISYWSLNRDSKCSPNDAPIANASDHCSHLDQDDGAFAAAFASITGRAADAAGGGIEFTPVTVLDDDPELSPYPIWAPNRVFLADEKAVWHGYVYQAKWWTEGDNPEAPVVNPWDTPWKVVGPVLAEDLVEPLLVPPDAAPAWNGEVVYVEGDRVWLDDAVYQAKWWNEGFQPNREAFNGGETPWRKLDPAIFVGSEG